MRTKESFLYSLMPQLIKKNDAESGYALQRLMSVIQEELDELELGVERLYESWFIETCPDEILPLIATMVGIELDPVMPPLPSHRRLIANAVEYRREKGLEAPPVVQGCDNHKPTLDKAVLHAEQAGVGGAGG